MRMDKRHARTRFQCIDAGFGTRQPQHLMQFRFACTRSRFRKVFHISYLLHSSYELCRPLISTHYFVTVHNKINV